MKQEKTSLVRISTKVKDLAKIEAVSTQKTLQEALETAILRGLTIRLPQREREHYKERRKS